MGIRVLLLVILLQSVMIVEGDHENLEEHYPIISVRVTEVEIGDFRVFDDEYNLLFSLKGEIWNKLDDDYTRDFTNTYADGPHMAVNLENTSIYFDYSFFVGQSITPVTYKTGISETEGVIQAYSVNLTDTSHLPNGDYTFWFGYHLFNSDFKTYNTTIHAKNGEYTTNFEDIPDNWGETITRSNQVPGILFQSLSGLVLMVLCVKWLGIRKS